MVTGAVPFQAKTNLAIVCKTMKSNVYTHTLESQIMDYVGFYVVKYSFSFKSMYCAIHFKNNLRKYYPIIWLAT